MWAFSSCGAQTSCCGFSGCRAQALDTQAAAVLAHGLSYSMACVCACVCVHVCACVCVHVRVRVYVLGP